MLLHYLGGDPPSSVRARGGWRDVADAFTVTAEALARESIDPAEAAWLSKRILEDDTIDENEYALLAFLKKEAKAIDPALKPLLARAKL